ncbi:MAG: AmmeMemoRadiSam system protein B, partial [Proteobacteria bacterium]|nr:AmmeMemoRadiSam system protein B [Pseudomonadota bacterium]
MSDLRYRKFPALRWPIDVQFHEIDGTRVVVLSCPHGISEAPLGLHAATAPLLQQFQGKRSIAEIAAEFHAQGCTTSLLEELVELLDRHLFLESPRFTSAAARAREEFIKHSERPAYLAGLGYSADPTELSQEIERFLGVPNTLALPVPQRPLLGLISPHIDYRRGGGCYGLTWNQLRSQTHDLYLLIGTSHQYSEYLFHLTRKDFCSPLGILPADRGFIDDVASRYGPVRSFADELLHRREHSLELQTPFLRYLKNKPSIAPVLVGSFHQMLTSGKTPQQFGPYEDFVSALAEVCKMRLASGQRICL